MEEVARMEGVTLAQDRPEGFLIRVEGKTLRESLSRAAELGKKLGAEESPPLTIQFVPSGFQRP
jgi:hypothetical protein